MKSLLSFQGDDLQIRYDRLKRQNGNIDLAKEAHPVDIFGNKITDLKGKLSINDKNRHHYFQN